jgi:hypothetical protein
LPPDRALLERARVRFIVLFTPAGISPWETQAMRVYDGVSWLHRVDARDPAIVVYAVDWD